MLVDKVEVEFKGGDGGDGKVSFAKTGRGPDGGNGGKGGDLYVIASSDLTLLNQFTQKTKHSAPNGTGGDKDKKSMKKGDDLEIFLPVGTSIVSKDTGEEILELSKVGQKVLLCKGGMGGAGNWELRSARMTTPKFAKKGRPGEKLNLILNLKLIADFGLIGLPNAGKSSLLNELTRANVKTANYAFTTLSPNLGVFKDKMLADIPGLIEGASKGKGLGIGFLKHIEKVKVLIHCISAESQNPIKDYEVIRNELGQFSSELLKKKEIILLTKSDLIDPKEVDIKVKKLKNTSKVVLPISIHDLDSLEKFKEILVKASR